MSEPEITIKWKQCKSGLTEIMQFEKKAIKELGITFPEFQIQNQMKANGDLTPWKRFLYLFCPGLKRRARVRAMLDLRRKGENYTDGRVYHNRVWWPAMFSLWKTETLRDSKPREHEIPEGLSWK